jgi:hypothetical protein
MFRLPRVSAFGHMREPSTQPDVLSPRAETILAPRVSQLPLTTTCDTVVCVGRLAQSVWAVWGRDPNAKETAARNTNEHNEHHETAAVLLSLAESTLIRVRCAFTPWAPSAYAASLFDRPAIVARGRGFSNVLRIAPRSNQPWLLSSVAPPPANFRFCW